MLVSIHKLRVVLLVVICFVAAFASAKVWTLEQCIDTALVKNKTLQMSRTNIALGEERHKEATGGLIPKIMVSADYRYYIDQPTQLMPASIFGGPVGTFKEARFGVPHNINASAQVSMPLYNPQVYGAIKTTKIATELNDLQYEKREEQVYFEISNLYYNAQIISHQLTFIGSNLMNTKRVLKNLQLVKEQGLAKNTDLMKMQLQLDQLTNLKETVLSKYDQVMNALKFTLGIPITDKMEIEQEIQFEEKSDYTTHTTLDIRLVKTQNRFLESELSTLINSRLPSLSVYGAYGTTGYGYDTKPNDFLKFFPVSFAGVQLSYPLFNGTVTQRKINQKKLELKNNALQSELISEQNNMQIINARQQKMVATTSVKTANFQIKLAQSIYDQTVLQQKQGTANLTDILLVDNSLRESQQTYLSAIVDYLKADLEHKKLTGNIK
ncbi:MAG: TolC family protein [Paludibacter sp.]|nr:TolC family protein [Paludibacter sp.]